MRTTLQIALYMVLMTITGAVLGILEVIADRQQPGVVLWIVGVGAVVALTVRVVRRRRVEVDVDAVLEELGVRAVPPTMPPSMPLPEATETPIVPESEPVRRQVPRRYVRGHDA